MMRCLWIFAAVAILGGCQSEVDKCVAAEMKSWRITNETNIRYNKEKEAYNKEVEVYNEEVKKFNESLPSVDATYIKDGRKMIDLDKLFENTKRYREKDVKTIDQRPIEVVEAERRRICMSLK